MEFKQITTRGGDRGDSSLYNGERRGKDELIFECLGDIDELSSWLGLIKVKLSALAGPEDTASSAVLEGIQKRLILMGGEVATPRSAALFHKIEHLNGDDILWLEEAEHAILEQTTIPPLFVLAGGNEISALTDIGRTICRRTERSLVRCIRKEGMIHLAEAQHFLNRLSDYLFVLARNVAPPQNRTGEH